MLGVAEQASTCRMEVQEAHLQFKACSPALLPTRFS